MFEQKTRTVIYNEVMLENLENLPAPRRRRTLLYGVVGVAAAGVTLFLYPGKKDASDEVQNTTTTPTTAVYQLDTQTLPPPLPPGETIVTVTEGVVLPIDHHPSPPVDATSSTLAPEQGGVSVDPTSTDVHDHPSSSTATNPEVTQQGVAPTNPDTHQHPAPVVTVAAAEQPVTVTTAATHQHPTPAVTVVATTAPPAETVPATLAPVGTPETVPSTIAPPMGTIAAPAG
jgi:hypothetical protein